MRAPQKPKAQRRRLETPIKQYGLHDCALYALKGHGQLLSILAWQDSFEDLEKLVSDEHNYAVWSEEGRTFQSPRRKLRKLQSRIATLLRRIKPPDYRHSGVKKRSFVTNALTHLSGDPMVKLDVRKFYPSTSFKHVFNFFHHVMNCSADVADMLAAICCIHRKHVPTGGVHSEVLAFYCHKKVLDALDSRAAARGGVFSSYVDDMALSAPNASLTDLEWARARFKQRGLKIHPGKSTVIAKRSDKVLTGVQLSRGFAHAPTSPRIQ